MSWFTRKNPWYMAALIIGQFGLAMWFFNKETPDLFWGGFMIWACGVNIGYTFSGNPPDMA